MATPASSAGSVSEDDIADEVASSVQDLESASEEIAAMVDQTAANATEITDETRDISAAVQQQTQMIAALADGVELLLHTNDVLDD